MKEVWRNIEGYDHYQVSNLGRVRSVKICGKGVGKGNTTKGGILVPQYVRGYQRVNLCNENGVRHFSVHRLVAKAFPEICGKWFEGCHVNHKDEQKDNNVAANLETCTCQYNVIYGTAKKRRVAKLSMPVDQYSADAEFIETYPSISEASRASGVNAGNICACCKGEQLTAGGFIWQYHQ